MVREGESCVSGPYFHYDFDYLGKVLGILLTSSKRSVLLLGWVIYGDGGYKVL